MDILSLPPIKAKAYEQYLCGPTKHCQMERAVSSASAPIVRLVLSSNRTETLSHVPGQFQCMNWILGGPMD